MLKRWQERMLWIWITVSPVWPQLTNSLSTHKQTKFTSLDLFQYISIYFHMALLLIHTTSLYFRVLGNDHWIVEDFLQLLLIFIHFDNISFRLPPVLPKAPLQIELISLEPSVSVRIPYKISFIVKGWWNLTKIADCKI